MTSTSFEVGQRRRPARAISSSHDLHLANRWCPYFTPTATGRVSRAAAHPAMLQEEEVASRSGPGYPTFAPSVDAFWKRLAEGYGDDGVLHKVHVQQLPHPASTPSSLAGSHVHISWPPASLSIIKKYTQIFLFAVATDTDDVADNDSSSHETRISHPTCQARPALGTHAANVFRPAHAESRKQPLGSNHTPSFANRDREPDALGHHRREQRRHCMHTFRTPILPHSRTGIFLRTARERA